MGYPPPLPKCVQWSCSLSTEEFGPFLPSLPVSLAGESPNPLEKLRLHLRNSVHPLLLSVMWFLFTHAFHSLWLKEIVQPSKTFFEGGTLLIHLWIHLAWCPAHRNYSVFIDLLLSSSLDFMDLKFVPLHPSDCLTHESSPRNPGSFTWLCRSYSPTL